MMVVDNLMVKKHMLKRIVFIRSKMLLATMCFLFLFISVCHAQIKHSRLILIKNVANYKYEYEVLKSDTSVKDGFYKFYYKSKMIENGTYKSGEKVGLWRFYNLKGIFEYEYDFKSRQVTRLSGDRDPSLETPCLFNGSPLIPYLFIVQHVRYPKEAADKDLSGKVVLGLKINKEGKIWALYLVEKFHPSFDAEVMRVAREFPRDWEWLPATKFKQPIDGEYLITIEFELSP
jgi:hypothetical protein